jgi:hypothetical protein
MNALRQNSIDKSDLLPGRAQLVMFCLPLISALYKNMSLFITTGQGIENLHSNPLSRVVLPDQRTADRRTSHPPSRHLFRYCAQTRTGKYERRNACSRRPVSPAMLGGGPVCPLPPTPLLSRPSYHAGRKIRGGVKDGRHKRKPKASREKPKRKRGDGRKRAGPRACRNEACQRRVRARVRLFLRKKFFQTTRRRY